MSRTEGRFEGTCSVRIADVLALVRDDRLRAALGLGEDATADRALALLRSTERLQAALVARVCGTVPTPEDAGGFGCDEADDSLLKANADELRDIGRHAAALRLAPLIRRTVCGDGVRRLTRALGERAFASALLVRPGTTEACDATLEGAEDEPARCLRAWRVGLGEPLAMLVLWRFGADDPFGIDERSASGADADRVDAMREAARIVHDVPHVGNAAAPEREIADPPSELAA